MAIAAAAAAAAQHNELVVLEPDEIVVARHRLHDAAERERRAERRGHVHLLRVIDARHRLVEDHEPIGDLLERQARQ